MILVPRPVSGEEIILPPQNPRLLIVQRPMAVPSETHHLVLAMADDALNDGIEVIPMNKEVPLWKEGHLVLVAKYLDGERVGEKDRLINVSPSVMRLVEQDRRGVRAVSVEHHVLRQGDSTDIYIVRYRKADE